MRLTVFTPTYNRAQYLQRLYESLCRQKVTDFEWLIVDDGSTDDTAQVVDGLRESTHLNIRYLYKENGGKHTAYNEALRQAQGQWFLCVDADDYLSDDALAVLFRALEQQPENCGLAAYKADQQGNRLSDAFPEQVKQCKISDLPLQMGCRGEFTFIFPTAVAREYPFPVFPGERFVGENVVYDRIEKVCPVTLLGEVITVCEYLSDGYSQNFGSLMKKNPSGFCIYFQQRIDLVPGLISRVSMAGKYWCFRWISGNKTLKYRGTHRLAWLLGWPVGLLFRVYYKILRGI